MALRLWLVIPPQWAQPTLLQNTHHIRWLLKHCWILTFLGHYRIWCILLFQLSVCHAKPHVWQSSKHLKKMAEKIQKKYKNFFQFLQKETICMRKKQAAMAVVVAEGVRNGKISARHILRFKGQKSTFFNSLHWPYALQGCPLQHFLNDIDSCLLWAKRYAFLKNRAFFGF